MKACEENGRAIADHFVRSYKTITGGKGAKQDVTDVLLSRYAAYLVVMNGDPKMPIVAMGQEYFAEQTRRQELAAAQADAIEALPEDQKRLYRRAELSIQNVQLAAAAHNAGVITSQDFATFQDHGYRGLYTLTENQIHARKGLQPGERILDYMGSDELIANAFRASQARQKLEREQVKEKDKANRTHYQVGREVRNTIKRLGGTMPENLPTPQKSIQELQREQQKQLEAQRQPSLFEEPESTDEKPS